MVDTHLGRFFGLKSGQYPPWLIHWIKYSLHDVYPINPSFPLYIFQHGYRSNCIHRELSAVVPAPK